MKDYLIDLWGFSVQLVPMLLALIIIELPNYIRQMKRLYYVPIYFSIYPLRELNGDLSWFLDEDYNYYRERDKSEAEISVIKRRIQITSVISIAISAVAIPALAGFLFAFIFDRPLITQFTIVAGLYYLWKCVSAIKNFKFYAVASRKNTILLALVYFGNIGVFLTMVNKTFSWTFNFVESNNWSGLFYSLADLVFSQAIASAIILAGVTAVIIEYFTKERIKDEDVQ